jgi:hypothetical protein
MIQIIYRTVQQPISSTETLPLIHIEVRHAATSLSTVATTEGERDMFIEGVKLALRLVDAAEELFVSAA